LALGVVMTNYDINLVSLTFGLAVGQLHDPWIHHKYGVCVDLCPWCFLNEQKELEEMACEDDFATATSGVGNC